MNEWIAKPWGKYRVVHQSDSLHVVEAEAGAGGRSSVHVHNSKANTFYVSRGRLKIETCKQGGFSVNGDAQLAATMELFIVTAGQTVIIPPGIYHQFTAMEDSAFVEVYTPDMLAAPGDRKVIEDDIVRFKSFEEVIRLW